MDGKTFFESFSKRGKTLSCAESCTGGLIGAEITSVPGASSFFLGSAVTYSNDAKQRLLGVPLGILIQYGAVSSQTAKCMAEGSWKLYGSDIAVAVTGIAGPGGATDTKPVGLVYIAVASEGGTEFTENVFKGDRDEVRRQTVEKALSMVLDVAESLDQ